MCELNLWGIETNMNHHLQNSITHVWIEPVRDWNFVFLRQFWNSQMRVNWTCEGLKLKIWATLKPPFSTCELNLWGIETCIYATAHAPAPIVWIEPVRDWNLFINSPTSLTSSCVNWTCEGLKQNLVFIVDESGSSVNWTCEGLKLLCPHAEHFEIPSVNWTCEGLKPTWHNTL